MLQLIKYMRTKSGSGATVRRMCWTDLIHIQTANPVQSWLHTATSALFADSDTAVSTARAGNVIGGGDFASDRIIPDCYRSAVIKQSVTVRNPYSIRPYQHVLEPLFLYLTIVRNSGGSIHPRLLQCRTR